jgi:hypothetical protein
MGHDGVIYGGTGHINTKKQPSWSRVNLPTGYNKVDDIVKGAKLIPLLKQNK